MADIDPRAPLKRFKPTRRGFLIGGAVTTGLAVGFAFWPRQQRLNWLAGPDETRINGWVKIGSDGRVVVAVPQAEMGQGVYTALPQILADELGADWNSVAVEPAPINPIYANRALANDATANLSPMLRDVARWGVGKFIDVQLTAGSTSVRAFHDVIRLAGAAAREMLCRAAARQWDADWQDLDTENGFVIYKANRIRFAEIAVKAGEEDAPRAPELRDPKRNRLMGVAVPRIDIPSKTDGSARFGIDVRIPNMVFASVRSGPVGDPALVSVDGGKVRKMPGVIAVVPGPSWVAVVAASWWQANGALETLKPKFAAQKRPAGPWMAKTLREVLASADPGKMPEVPDIDTVEEIGDAEVVLHGAGVITADYAVPYLAHACMEPMNATVRIGFDGNTIERVEVWAPTQSITLATEAVARALDVDAEAVTVFPTLLGGGFGRKSETDVVVQAALIALAVKRPVQLIWNRSEDFGHDKYRPAAAARLRGQIGADRHIAAWASRIAVPDVGHSFSGRNRAGSPGDHPSASAGAIEGAHHLPYALGHMISEHVVVELPVPIGYWRSVAHSFTGFFVESFIDELAHAAGVDPYAFRLSHLHDAPRHAAVLRAAMRAGGPLGLVEPGVGRGVALHESFGSIVALVADVDVKGGAIRVRRVVCAIDCGPMVNPGIVHAQCESAILFGLGAALNGEITFTNGEAQQRNFDTAPLLSLAQTPIIEIIHVASAAPIGGVGEAATPPMAPALANAVYAATGKRLRELPLLGKI